jgi:predicted ATPase/serine/threonine protein kinase/DNA-binding NarL/FixJ family response regulator
MAERGQREGQQLGPYQLIQLLGQGHWASVYLGEHRHLHTQAAIKVLQGPLASNEVEDFLTEARTIARLRHSHIVRVLDFGVQEGTPFLVMEYAPGGTLRQRHPKGSQLPLETVVSYVKQVASALQYAHEQRLIHRDLKPENLLLGPDQEVLLSDFGLAIVAQSSRSQPSQQTAGTIAYMAPEQLKGHPTAASDQYALGVLVYEWLCGERPFSGLWTELAVKQTFVPPPSLAEKVPTIPAVVEQVVLKALAKDPKSRFACVQDFALALERACSASGVFSAPSPGEATVAADPSSLALVQSQRSPADEPEVGLALASERHASVPTTPPEPVLARALWRVPTSLTSFIGRQQDVATICALLMRPEVRLLTLTGPGGIGKTRLSLQVAAELAEQFADGVVFVNLAPLSDAEQVVPTIAQALGVREQGNRPLLDRLQDSLRDRQLLLLLDNFEQVLTAAVPVAELLAACPRLKIMVTSRVVLHVQAEREWAVSPLALPTPKELPNLEALSQCEAVALFIERAQAVRSDFALTAENAPAIAAICQQVDGLPLAIELAAGRSKLFSPQALLTRLENRLKLLVGGARDLPLRQQTLRGTIVWSYDLLDKDEKTLFRRLAVFVGGCTLEAAAAVCNALGDLEEDVLDGVARLVDKSLLRQEAQADGEPRLLLLETIREYALERLKASGETEVVRRQHALFFLAMAEEAQPKLHGPNQAAWVERLELEHDNLRAALNWALEEVADKQARERREVALRLSAALVAFWRRHGHYREGRTFLERALAQSEGASASLRAKVLGATAYVAYRQGNLDRAEVLARQRLALDRELGDTRGIANCFFLLGTVAWMRGKIVEAITLSEERIRLMRPIGQPGEVANALFQLAWLVSVHGEYTRGQALFEEALVLFRKAGNELMVGAILFESAEWLFWSTLGDAATIRQRLQQGQALITKVGDPLWSAMSSWLAVLVALSEGETARAFSLIKESLAIFREMDSRWHLARTLHILGRVEAQQGELTAARNSYQESLALCRQLGEKWIIPFNLEGLASIVAAQGELRWAAQLWGAAEALREGIAFPLLPSDRASYEQAVAAARAQLGEEAFASAWAKGRAMPLEQVIAQALETKDAPPTEASPPEADAKEASSDLPPGALSSPPSPPLSPHRALKQHFGGLTSREREVARLVAQGKSNRAIADELVVGVSTVEAHISHIFTKLGVSSRAQIAAWAVEKGLAQASQDGEVTRQKP